MRTMIVGLKSSHVQILPMLPCIVAVTVAVAVFILPSPIDPQPFIFKDPPALEGPLERNTILQNVQKLFIGQLIGPESFAVDKHGNLYTGTSDGKLWRIKEYDVSLVTYTGSNHSDCGSPAMESTCGRPKGMKFSSDGSLIVADAYKGLLRVNTEAGTVSTLVTGINGKPFCFLNGLDIADDDKVYFTESTTKWQRNKVRYEIIETNNFGRVLEYDLHSGKMKTVLGGLYMANGVALSQDQTFLLVAEMSVARITKYYLKGPNAGMRVVVNDNLPGYPDNIQLHNGGMFYVGIGATRYQGQTFFKPFLDFMGPLPAMKRAVVKVTPMWAYDLFMSKHCIILEIDGNGNIVNSFHDPTGQVIGAASEAFRHEGKLYIGHYETPFVGVLDSKWVTVQ